MYFNSKKKKNPGDTYKYVQHGLLCYHLQASDQWHSSKEAFPDHPIGDNTTSQRPLFVL